MPGEVPPQGKKPRLWPLLFGLLLFVLLATVIPAWLLWKYGLFRQRPQVLSGPVGLKQSHVPAELSELHGEGEIYFVPLGKQVVAPESLIQHYKSKFNLTIHLLAPLGLERRTFNPDRKQYDADEMVEQIKRAYPDLAKDPKAVIIGLTDQDIYISDFNWKFTYSYRTFGPLEEARFGLVSTRRMDDVFWGDPPHPERIELRDRQMITKYIAVLYFRLPLSSDPESLLYQPFTPDGRPDDLWESDVHPEDSVFGLHTTDFCLGFSYSPREGKMMDYGPEGECNLLTQARTDVEMLRIYPKNGDITFYKTDFEIPGQPPIIFQRISLQGYKVSGAFGLGGSHIYDRYLSTNNTAVMHDVELVYPDGDRRHFVRTSPGRGSMLGMTFRGEDGEYEDSKLTKESEEKLTIKLIDGRSYSYLACAGKSQCHNYESGYKDAEGNELKYTRGAGQFLTAIASKNGSLTLKYDPKLRITEIQDQNKHHVLYQYDDAGYLSKVTSDDGTVTTYEHGEGGHTLNISVASIHHSKTMIFTAEFDGEDRIVKATIPDEGIYTFQYETSGKQMISVLMTSPDRKKVRISYNEDSCVARSEK